MNSKSFDAIKVWLASQLAEMLRIPADEIDEQEPFTSYGLSSVKAIGLSGDLEEYLGRNLSPSLFYDHPTIESLARHLAGERNGNGATSKAAPISADSTSADSIAANPATSAEPDKIAIIGIGCRFPGASGPQRFWQLLCDGRDAITEVPADRWNADDYFDDDPQARGKMNTRRGGFLECVDEFDHHFFGISPREAARMDPQQRLLMEVAWEALEDAGQPPKQLAGSEAGLFIGVSNSDYSRMQLNEPDLINPYVGTGSSLSIAANRLSYFFDFHGPSMAIDTACSSSLVAVHLACQSLRSGEADLALAGGVNLILAPEVTINFAKAGTMAPDGRCKAFDAAADGYVRSEGAGVVVLKLLSKALADNDPIYAVIRASAINQDGRTNGLMAPSGTSQQALLRKAYHRAGISPGEVQYVETMGTGTLLGDSIEANALGSLLTEGRAPDRPCIIGSVKTNLGHLEAASGIASLIKVALALKHRTIPASLHFSEPSPLIHFDEVPLHVQRTLTEWPDTSGRARLAGVSAFGFGGTNAHVVVEEAPAHLQPEVQPQTAAQLLTISARTAEALRALAKDYQEFFLTESARPTSPLRDICYTANTRRTHHNHRLAVVAHSCEEFAEKIEQFLKGEPFDTKSSNQERAARLDAIGASYAAGAQVDWASAQSDIGQIVPLPAYPWQRERCWFKERETSGGLSQEGAGDLQASARIICEQTLGEMLALPRNEQQALLEDYLCRQAAEVMEILPSRLSANESLNRLGIDSLMALVLKKRIQEQWHVDVPTTDFLRGDSIAELAAFIVDRLTQSTGAQYCSITPSGDTADQHPLSYGQQGLWLFDQLDPGNPVYNLAAAARLKGPLNIPALIQSLDHLTRRHQILRTTFSAINGEAVQVVSQEQPFQMPIVDLGELAEAEREAEMMRIGVEEAQTPFDLARGPLLRVSLLRLDPQHHLMQVSMHHIISDTWSLRVFTREVAAIYKAYCNREPVALDELPIQYTDFARWQRQWFESGASDHQLSYWKEQLEGASAILDLPTASPRPAIQSFRGARQSIELPDSLTELLKALSQSQGATLFMTLLAAFNALLYRYTGQEDILIGTPVAGRNRVEVEGLIGYFLNPLAIRARMGGDPGFRELVDRVRQACLGAYANQELPFSKIVEAIQPDRETGRTPLFQVMFNYLPSAGIELQLPGVTAEIFSRLEMPGSKFDLTLYAREEGRALRLELVYNADIFEQERMAEMMGQLKTLLGGAAESPDQAISALPLLSEIERRIMYGRRNSVRLTDPFTEFAKEEIEQTITERFEKQVRKYPEKFAVITKECELTYSELNRAANRVARAILSQPLLSHGAEPAEKVALLFDHEPLMIVGILAALKAGKTYVPLDPHHPEDRLLRILQDADAKAIVTNGPNLSLALALANNRIEVINIAETHAQRSDVLDISISPQSVAYILYTSGSTGQPKGIMQSHRNVLHHIRTYTNNLHISAEDRLTLFSSYCFDASVMDIFGALLNGATLYPINIKDAGPRSIYEWLNSRRTSIYHSTPTVYRHLINSLADEEQFPHARLVVLGGEEVFERDISLYKKHFSDDCIFVNGLGPTESTVSLQYFVNKQTEVLYNSVPVGYPVEETEVRLLNSAGAQEAIYGSGEIAIRSEYLALGYWQQPELTEARFLPDPDGKSRRVYLTGDMGRLMSDGSIEFTGRKDFQIKIRGHRIETAEIETNLLQHDAVKEATVVARVDERGQTQLSAYIVAREGASPALNELRQFLIQKLPTYMIPSAFVVLEAMPMTASGKIDRRKLPAPTGIDRGLEANFIAPRNPIERSLADIWAEALKVDRVGAHDDFFDLGGHSLLATQIVSAIREATGVELPLRALFESPTIGDLASIIELQKGEQKSVRPAKIQRVRRGGKSLNHLLAQLDQLSEDEARRMLLSKQL
jgi:amino acid adenylation domain-containing protein